MNTTKDSNRSFHSSRVTPKRSPANESVMKRRQEIKRSDRAAYWALFNSSIAALIYYDLCYTQYVRSISDILSYIELLVCTVFILSACYDFALHFWPHTCMEPIVINSWERKLLNVGEDEFGFQIEEQKNGVAKECKVHDNVPPFEISFSSEEDW